MWYRWCTHALCSSTSPTSWPLFPSTSPFFFKTNQMHISRCWKNSTSKMFFLFFFKKTHAYLHYVYNIHKKVFNWFRKIFEAFSYINLLSCIRPAFSWNVLSSERQKCVKKTFITFPKRQMHINSLSGIPMQSCWLIVEKVDYTNLSSWYKHFFFF